MVASNKDTPEKPSKRSGRKKSSLSKRKKKSLRMQQWGVLLLKLGISGFAIFMAIVVYLDAIVVQKFEGKKWAIPAKVYARPLELYEGRLLKPNELQNS